MNRILLMRAYVHTLRRHMCSKTTPEKPIAGAEANAASAGAAQSSRQSSSTISPQYRPSELQKVILVWTKKYKSKDEIPKYVSPDVIHKAQSQARIKIANVLMLLTALASLGAIISGKAAAKRGDSVHKMNMDFHKQYKEDYEKQHGAQPAK